MEVLEFAPAPPHRRTGAQHPSPGALSCLDEHDRTLASVGTDADDGAAAGWSRGKLLRSLAQNTGAGRAEGMTQRHAAAVRIHALARESAERRLDTGLEPQEVRILQGLDVRQHLRGERLVDFPEIDFGVAQTMAREQSG